VQGKENEQLTTPLSPELMAQIDDELQQELRLLSLLTPDIQEMVRVNFFFSAAFFLSGLAANWILMIRTRDKGQKGGKE
jgi:hypothetical protein